MVKKAGGKPKKKKKIRFWKKWRKRFMPKRGEGEERFGRGRGGRGGRRPFRR
jgi:hypothetical protein